MKNLIFVCFALILSITGFAQNQSIEAFYNKYMGYEAVTEINLDGFLLTMAASFSDDEATKDISTKITKIRMLIMDEGNIVERGDKKSLMSSLRGDKFEELMQIRDGKSKIDFMIRESGKKITNVLMLVDDEDSFILLSLEGNLSWKDIKNLNIDIDGAEKLKKIPRA